MTIDEAALRKLAEAATPGPCDCGHKPHQPGTCTFETSPGVEDGNSYDSPSYCQCGTRDKRAASAFNLTANPSAVLGLLDLVAALRSERDEARAALADQTAATVEAAAGRMIP